MVSTRLDLRRPSSEESLSTCLSSPSRNYSLRGFVFLASILSLVCIVLNMAAQHEVGERSASSTAARRPSASVETRIPFVCCRQFVRRRQAAGGMGKIVNITSVHERIPSPNKADYGAAKGGLLTFTRSLALEVAESRINVNAVAPGLISRQ